DVEDVARAEAAANRERLLVGRRIHDRQADLTDVRADGKAEEDDLHDRNERDDRERPPIAQDVERFLPQQAEQRGHGRARRTNTSSIDATSNRSLSSAGVPSAPIRPATMIETRSQYSASSM